LEEFLEKDSKEQLRIIRPYFQEFFAKYIVPPPIAILFMNLFLYFGCGFDYMNCLQIISEDQVSKENKGFKTVKIMGDFILNLLLLIIF
jgi:hypothetical protein